MAETKKIKREKEIPDKKLKSVAELEGLIKKSKSFVICSIQGLPGKQFQAIKKKLREHAKIKVVKKSSAIRAIENSRINPEMKKHVKEDCALLFSDLDAFELSGILSENKNPVGAKAGQIAPEDIVIDAGATELVPGPVISELGSLGLKIAIEDGKIAIKEKKVIVKAGMAINENAASLMAKLDIKPFSVGYEPVAAYMDKKIYVGIKINKEKSLEDLKHAFSKALAFAVKIAYPCKESIRYLLGKAASHEKALAIKMSSQSTQATEETKSGEDK